MKRWNNERISVRKLMLLNVKGKIWQLVGLQQTGKTKSKHWWMKHTDYKFKIFKSNS